MKKVLVVMIMMAILTVGCTPKSPFGAQQQAVQQQETSPTPTKLVEEPAFTKLIKKAKAFESVSYDLGETGLPQRKYTVSLKGNKMKLALPDYVYTKTKEYYDTVYLDTLTNDAVGYCESRQIIFCPDNNKQFPVNWKEYKHKTPFDWLNNIEDPHYDGVEIINARETIKLSYLKNNQEVFIWIDNFYGLPVKVVEPSGNSWFFNYRNVNNVKDADVMYS